MSTFLELAQQVRQEAGLSGTGPAGVVSQVGMDKKVVDWVRDAWIDIQELNKNWRFLWKDDGSITTVQGQRAYDLNGLGFNVRSIEKESFHAYLSTVGNDMWLTFEEYPEFRRKYLYGIQVSGRPISVTWTPDNRIMLHPIPSDVYNLRFEYYRTPQVLAANTDVPLMPQWMHRAIVYRALMYYAAHDENQVLYTEAQTEFNRWRNRMEEDQLATPMVAGALV